ncbi:hypothetical protein [Citrobacter braakii]|uniref:Uncharacterized protein n=1 Tax=Citrobacter braakii TaxID=57706 RepID=A0A1V8P2N9_CITBR|nr:hypothetical protein BZK42_05170 [Citrobacter braakii]HCU0795780.1 hypothetical protein [Citrobacter braakii]
MTGINTQQVQRSASLATRATQKDKSMIDFARKPVRCQAVHLNRIEVIIRLICYILAQKGDPSADQQTAVRS